MELDTIKQNHEQIEQNPVGLTTIAAKKVSNFLDTLLASYSAQYHQYLKRYWLVEGPEHRDLRAFFKISRTEVQFDMDTFAERMTTLSSVPTCGLQAQQALAFIDVEAEGLFPIREMITQDLENEQTMILHLKNSIFDCNQLDDFATETLLKQSLIKAEDRIHNLDHYIANDTLQPSADNSIPQNG